jgi:membrane AbrB-like protein
VSVLRFAGALLICALAGALFSYWRTPLPWMIGPLIAMAVVRFSGLPVAAPPGGREVGQAVIAVALGLYFTPSVAGEVVAHWPLLVSAAVLAIVLAYASGWFLARSAGLDATTALFASVPGGAAEMTILGERFGALADRIALAQSVRILVVVLVVPAAFALADVHGNDLYQPEALEFRGTGLAALLLVGGAAGALCSRLNLPNAWMLGPLGASIALTVTEMKLSSIPGVITNAAQVLIGCSLGSRFDRESLSTAPRFIFMVCISVLIAIVLSAMMAYLIATVGGVPVPTMVLATAPGGIAEMCVTAKVLRLGVPLVTAAHVTRIAILVTTTGPLFRLARRLRRGGARS